MPSSRLGGRASGTLDGSVIFDFSGIGLHRMSLVQRDYILRIFEQMGQVVAIVIGLKKNGEPAEAMKVMNDSLQGLVGFDLDDIERLGAEDLIQMVRLSRSGSSSAAEVVPGQLAVIAGLLVEAAGVYEMQGEPARADVARIKALHLYLVILTEERLAHDVAMDGVSPLIEQLSEYALPFELTVLLWRYHEQVGDYARAEDCLFELLEEYAVTDTVVPHGVAFYQRLLALSDSELTSGGLPRDEVEAGLRELESM